MKNKFHYISHFFMFFFCLVNANQAIEFEHVVDMWDEPRHQLLFSSEQVRLLLVNIPAGDTSLLHKHEFATCYVILEDALMTSRDVGAEWSTPRHRALRSAGRVVDRADYYAKPFAHQVRNVSSNTFTVLALLNTRQGHYHAVVQGEAEKKLLLDNDWFREHRLDLSPGESTAALKFVAPVVVIQVSAGSSAVVGQHSMKTVPGAWSVHKAGEGFQLRNNSARDIQFVLLEVK